MKARTSGLASFLAPFVVGAAAVVGMAFQPVAAVAVDPGPKCESAKVNEVAKKAKCVANVSSKAIKKSEAVDAAKLGKCSTKFNEKFVKSETKAAGACPTNGDASTIEGLVDGCVNAVVVNLGGVPGPGGEEAKCQSKKAKEAGKYAQCKFKASSKAIKKALSPDFTKCDTKLSEKWAKIEAKPPCSTNGDLSSVKADLDACHVTITDALGGLCGNGSLDPGEECDDGNTVGGDGCSALCLNEPLVEYQQDFEALVQSDPDALANDASGAWTGWLVGANVFAGLPPGGGFLYNYFAFPAPNGGPAFSAIDAGQGGTGQGAQQLSIYSDYNNLDHANGNTIEAIVFKERFIVAGDVGRTFTFQFDHKAGNINDPGDPNCQAPNPPCNNTAEAFIKTLDPGFNTIDYVQADMTAIPSTWGTTPLTLAIDVSKVGYRLQIGFQNKASKYQPVGIFYDNLVASTLPTP
jgi:cysteine-rich repeat protein